MITAKHVPKQFLCHHRNTPFTTSILAQTFVVHVPFTISVCLFKHLLRMDTHLGPAGTRLKQKYSSQALKPYFKSAGLVFCRNGLKVRKMFEMTHVVESIFVNIFPVHGLFTKECRLSHNYMGNSVKLGHFTKLSHCEKFCPFPDFLFDSNYIS